MSVNTVYCVLILFFQPDIVVCDGLVVGGTAAYVRLGGDRQKNRAWEEARGKLSETTKDKRTI